MKQLLLVAAAVFALSLAFAHASFAFGPWGQNRHNPQPPPDPAAPFKTCAQVLPPGGKTLAGPGYFSEGVGLVYAVRDGERPPVCITIANISASVFICQSTSFPGGCAPNNTDVDPMDVRSYCYNNFPPNGGDNFRGIYLRWRVSYN